MGHRILSTLCLLSVIVISSCDAYSPELGVASSAATYESTLCSGINSVDSDAPQVDVDVMDHGSADGSLTVAEECDYLDWYNNYNWASDNRDEDMSWKDSVVLRSVIDMYEMTGAQFYLDEITERVDDFLASRESAHEHVQNRTINAWHVKSSDSNNYFYSNLVRTSMILYPIARAANMIKNDASLAASTYQGNTTYGGKADEWIKECNDTIDLMMPIRETTDDVRSRDWANKTDGTYWLPHWPRTSRLADIEDSEKRETELAYNRQLVATRVLMELLDSGEIAGDRYDWYATIVGDVAEHFMDGKVLQNNDTELVWYYALPGWNTNWEDIGHGGLDIEAIQVLRDLNYDSYSSYSNVFTDNKMGKIAAAFLNTMYMGSGEFQSRMWGSGCKDRHNQDSRKALRWISLAAHDEMVYNKLRKTWENGYFESTGLSFTRFIRWRYLCESHAANRVCGDWDLYTPRAAISLSGHTPNFPAYAEPSVEPAECASSI